MLTNDPADAFDEIVARLTAEEKGLEDKGPPIVWPALDRLPDVLLTAIVVLFILLIVMLGPPF